MPSMEWKNPASTTYDPSAVRTEWTVVLCWPPLLIWRGERREQATFRRQILYGLRLPPGFSATNHSGRLPNRWTVWEKQSYRGDGAERLTELILYPTQIERLINLWLSLCETAKKIFSKHSCHCQSLWSVGKPNRLVSDTAHHNDSLDGQLS